MAIQLTGFKPIENKKILEDATTPGALAKALERYALPDNQIYANLGDQYAIGEGEAKRFVDTSAVAAGQKSAIDADEGKVLAKLMSEEPAKAIQALYADSVNGTAPTYKETFKTEYGDLEVTARIYRGNLSMKAIASFKPEEAARLADDWLAAANPAFGPNESPKAEIDIQGTLNPRPGKEGIENVRATVKVGDLPRMSLQKAKEKLFEKMADQMTDIFASVRTATAETDPAAREAKIADAEKQAKEGVKDAGRRALDDLSIPTVLLGLLDGSPWAFENAHSLKEKSGTSISGNFGDDQANIRVTDVLGNGKKADQVRVDAKGKVERLKQGENNSEEVFALRSGSIRNEEYVHLVLGGEDGKTWQTFVSDGSKGNRERASDDLIAWAPMVFGMLQSIVAGEKPF